MIDPILIDRLKSKNQEAWEEVFSEHWYYIKCLCSRMLDNPDMAKDCAQETFGKAFENIHKFEGKSSLKTWITRIAINQCNMRIRSSKIRMIQDLNPKALRLDTIRDLHAPNLMNHDVFASRRIARAISDLPSSYSEVFTRFVFQEMRYEDIALDLEISLYAVAHRMKESKRFLARRLRCLQPQQK